ncbi:MAG: NADPH2:quinone reductase [Saprospiraceae bacterium]|jgi:NADPH2:quinone reductase
MKAVWYNKFGNPKDVLVYGEQEIVAPAANEVQVKLSKSGVNPSDTKKRNGAAPTLLDNGFVIPNSDGSGVITAIGAGVYPGRLGERVWVYNGQYGRRLGTSAEYLTLPKNQAVNLPEQASFEVGACMGIPAMTAHRCVTIGGEIKGKIVLVTGGAGRVGHYAIQWAKLFGATVIATAGSDTSRKHCLDAGADCVVGHPSSESTKAMMEFTKNEKIQLVVEGDFGVNLAPILDVLATSGTIATYSSMTIPEPSLPFNKMLFMDVNIRIVIVYAMPETAKDLAKRDITHALQHGQLRHRISGIFPLENSTEAHAAIEKGNQFGCVILDCD